MHPLSLLLKAGTGPEPRWSAVAPHARATQCGPSMLRAGNVGRGNVVRQCSAVAKWSTRERAANSSAPAHRAELSSLRGRPLSQSGRLSLPSPICVSIYSCPSRPPLPPFSRIGSRYQKCLGAPRPTEGGMCPRASRRRGVGVVRVGSARLVITVAVVTPPGALPQFPTLSCGAQGARGVGA